MLPKILSLSFLCFINELKSKIMWKALEEYVANESFFNHGKIKTAELESLMFKMRKSIIDKKEN